MLAAPYVLNALFKMIFVYITAPGKKEAEKIALHLIKSRLAACTNIFPIKSLYWWQGKIEKAGEYVCIAKTLERHFPKLRKEVKALHPYKVSCICAINVKANKEFESWLKKEVK